MRAAIFSVPGRKSDDAETSLYTLVLSKEFRTGQRRYAP